MAKRPTNAVATTSPAPAESGPRLMGATVVDVDAVYHVPAVKPQGEGPWKLEAEKVAWVDPATGLMCIIRRDKKGRHLCGYVAVPRRHPLFGWSADAIRQLGISAHGTITYAAECQRHEPEHVSVCHHDPNYRQKVAARDAKIREHRAQTIAQDVWWLGFECNQPYDLVPAVARFAGSATADGSAPEYRDEGYVHRQCVSLAAQLAAVGEGRPIPPAEPFPAIGLDPKRAGL